MGNRRQRWLLERSTALLNYLRVQGVGKRDFIDVLMAGGDRSDRSRRVSFGKAWSGERALRFDRLGDELSEVQVLERAWPGAGYYFFHPLWQLLTPVLRSAEKVRQRSASDLEWLLALDKGDLRRAERRVKPLLKPIIRAMTMRNEVLKAALRLRSKRSAAERTMDISLIHATMLQLRKPQRDCLLEPSVTDTEDVPHIHIPWVRKGQSLDLDLQALSGADAMDMLAIILALALEAGLTGREQHVLRLKEVLGTRRREILKSGLLDGLGKAVLRGVHAAIDRFGVVETHLIQAQILALPESWLQEATTWAMEMDE